MTEAHPQVFTSPFFELRHNKMAESLSVTVHNCLKALVTNSLNTNARAIAIRFHKRDLRLQVIDSGEGLSLGDLKKLGIKEHEGRTTSRGLKLFENNILSLRRNTASILVMSRQKSHETFGKMLTRHSISEAKIIPERPTQGTTVVVAFDRQENYDANTFISELKSIVGAFALNNPQVSFSFRDDKTMKILFGISKFSKPMDTLQMICNQVVDSERIQYIQNETIRNRAMTAYFGYDCSRQTIQRIFLNNQEVNCPAIEKVLMASYLTTVNSFGEGHGLHFGLRKEKICFLVYFTSPDVLDDLTEDEGFLDTIELRVVRAIFLQLHTISLKMLKHIFPLKIEDPVFKKPKASKKRKPKELKSATPRKKLLPDLKQISLPLLNFTCKDLRVSTSRYQHCKKLPGTREFDGTQPRMVTQKDQAVKDFSWIEHSEAKNLNFDDNFNEKAETCEKQNNEQWEQMSFGLDDGEWSDWIYEDSQSRGFEQQTYYNFLPQMLRSLLPVNRKQPLTRRSSFIRTREMGLVKWNRTEHKIEQTNLLRCQDTHIRPCKNSQKRLEITLEKDILKNMKVLNQVNKEFIAGVANYEHKKYLILIDQHAMDERIRYESLLREYGCHRNILLFSYVYHRLEIPDIPERMISLILRNSEVLSRFGVTFKEKNVNNVEVLTVPNCFLPRGRNNPVNTINSVKQLIMEIGEKLISKSGTTCLPVAIHNAVASEACHGAIRFNDVLTINQCETLVSHWVETDLPNRCAHGRPAVVPLMELTTYSRRCQHAFKEKLNFGALKKRLE